MKIAVFCPNWVGDMVMATPALRAVRQRYPLAEIVAVARPYVADVLAGLDLVDSVLLHDPSGRSPGREAKSGLAFLCELRRQQIDWAILLPNSFRSAWWAWLSGAQRRVGFNRNGRGWLLTDRVAPRPRDVPNPVIDEYLRLAEHLGCDHLGRDMELAVSVEDDRRLRRFWRRERSKSAATPGYVALNPGGAFGAAKHWPTASFARLARRLAIEHGRKILVLCGPSERKQAREIVAQARHPAVFSLADEELSLGLTKAAVRHAELLITTDSGPRHFAQPFGVPVVTLFGPTHPAWSETYYEKSLHLQLEVDCGPCQQRVCPLSHHLCMRELGVDWVFRAATSLLLRYSSQSKAA